MNSKIYLPASLFAFFAMFLFSSTSETQMRPACSADPTKPGACFFELDGLFIGHLGCGTPSATNDNLNEGLFVWVGVQGENDFIRVNPDGTAFIHQSNDEVISAKYCTWQSFFSGTCGDLLGLGAPGPETFVGNASVQVNGVLGGGGNGMCPFQLTGSGEVTRLFDGKTIEVRPKLILVPDSDSPTACREQRCDILKPGNNNDR